MKIQLTKQLVPSHALFNRLNHAIKELKTQLQEERDARSVAERALEELSLPALKVANYSISTL